MPPAMSSRGATLAGRLSRARRRQRGLDRAPHRLVHLARLAEAHLDLRRVDVHVDPVRRDVDEQRIGRLPAAVQHVLVGRAHAVSDQLVAHVAPVDVDVLLVGTRARRFGRAGPAGDAQHAQIERDLAAGLDEVVAEQVVQARFGRGAAPLLDQPAFVPHREGHVGPHERMAAHRLDAMGELGGVALEEFAPRRRAEEELAYLDARADRARGGRELAGAAVEPLRVRGLRRAARDGELGHRRDRGQRLAAKAHGRHAFQLVQRGDLARRVAAQRQRQLLGRDAAAVVLDHDGADAAGHQLDRDLARAGIERVVDQLAHHRGRPLHHLAGGDLADQLVGQFTDRAARRRRQHGIHRAGL
jgi:hypothetical protein